LQIADEIERPLDWRIGRIVSEPATPGPAETGCPISQFYFIAIAMLKILKRLVEIFAIEMKHGWLLDTGSYFNRHHLVLLIIPFGRCRIALCCPVHA
jgi:hypothetical protein